MFLFQHLYGRRTHHPPDLCLNSSFDAIFENPDGIIYVLKGKRYKSVNMESLTFYGRKGLCCCLSRLLCLSFSHPHILIGFSGPHRCLIDHPSLLILCCKERNAPCGDYICLSVCPCFSHLVSATKAFARFLKSLV